LFYNRASSDARQHHAVTSAIKRHPEAFCQQVKFPFCLHCGDSMKFRFPIVIIDEDFRSENTSGLGIRALADAIEKENWEVLGDQLW
jgi:hypothetical protein